MRSVLFAAILCVFVLAACNSTPQPTATSIPPTETAPPVLSGGDNPLGTLATTMGAPPPGTLVVPGQQETPNAPTPVPITIDSLIFTQTGGIAGISLQIELRGDGTLIRDGVTSTVSPEEVDQIAALLDDIRFFELQGIFTGPSGAADAYRYTLSVNSANGSRTISSEDGMTPPELYQVYDAIRNLNDT